MLFLAKAASLDDLQVIQQAFQGDVEYQDEGRMIIFKSNLWLKLAFLLTSWILSILVLIIVSTNNELNTLYNDAVSPGPELRPIKNQIGTLSYTRWDPEENYRPVYSACFKNFRAENSNLGIFKTALHKVVKIHGFKLEFYQYSSGKTTATTTPDIYPVYEETIADAKALIKEVMRKLINPEDGWCVNVNIDLGNVSEVRINNFDYQVFYEGDLFFSIQSKRAMASYKHSGIVLRGHVIIKTADGSTLESNYVKWDIEKRHFTVNGIYVINRNGVKTTGRNISVDAQLNSVEAQNAKVKRKENQECFAKL